MGNRALLVVAKRPTPGQTKTRLCPPLTARQAADLYNCLLLDTLALVRTVSDVCPIIAYFPRDAAGYFEALAPGFGLLPQKGVDLAERLDNALTDCLQNGFRQVVIMNSDGPTLPAANLRRAFEHLDKGTDVVLGPCEDGGYYLIGVTAPQPNLFRGIQMSTPCVMDETLARAQRAALSVATLQTWYDVDTAADLRRLAAELKAAAPGIGAHTQRFLTAHPELMDY